MNMKLVEKGDRYVCAVCENEYTASISHEEALKEYCEGGYFPPDPDDDDTEIVCDTCFFVVYAEQKDLIFQDPSDPSIIRIAGDAEKRCPHLNFNLLRNLVSDNLTDQGRIKWRSVAQKYVALVE